MDLNHSIGQEGCGIGLDYYGYIYINGKYFHVSNLANWQQVAKPCRGSTARHKGKAGPMFRFIDGKCEITLTLDLKEGTLRFSSGGHSIGTLANVKGPMHAALTLTSSKQTAHLAAGESKAGCVRLPVDCCFFGFNLHQGTACSGTQQLQSYSSQPCPVAFAAAVCRPHRQD
jgi:hypothetical protein